MTTGKPTRSHWTSLAASAIAACSLECHARPVPPDAAAPQQLTLATDVTNASPKEPGMEELYLGVTLNRVDTHKLGHFYRAHDALYTDAATLHALGLSWPGDHQAHGLVALVSLPGLEIHYDAANQRLSLTAPIELLGGPSALIGYIPPPPPRLDPAARAPGLLFNYDLYAQGGDGYRAISGWNELRLFGLGPGVWRTSSVVNATHSNIAGDDRQFIRLDTSWELDFPSSMVSVVVGDSTNGALDWTRATRFGGIRVSRDFNLQPYRVTVPLASFAGEATLPSTVDMFINGIRQSEQNVLPGRFQIDSAPVLNGAGQAQVVVTDITGQSRVVNFSLYNNPSMLQAGLSDWSFEAGKVRLDYGLKSFSYAADAMGTGTYRYGLSNFLTLEAHAEVTRDLSMGGGSFMLRMGPAGGVLSASYAMSQHAGDNGYQHGLGYEWEGVLLNVRLSTLRNDAAFADVASLAGTGLPRRVDQAFFGLNLGRGQLGTSYLRQDQAGGIRARYASLSWSQTTSRYGNFSLSFSHDLGGGTGSTAYVYWSLPLGDRRQVWSGAQHQTAGNTLTAGATQSIPGDSDGWGWRVQGAAGDQATDQAEVGQLTRFGEWRAGVQAWRGDGRSDTTAYVDVNGGVLLMLGSVFPMRRVDDSFALVTTDGIAGVPVMLENRFVGNTNDKGQLLVTELNAWQNNDVKIDPLVLPAEIEVGRVQLSVVPPTDSGVLARFPMRRTTPVMLALRAPDGQWVAPGTEARLESNGAPAVEVVVGYEGKVYLQDPPAGARLMVPLASGQCSIVLPDPLPGSGWLDLGELPCR
ncbi:fimbrial biogenesis outer membrane usher protein [Dyella telluris]|uniref:Fimbrial biogenesis outer membrane usher protein n=2 Tax=Dyella telluris TaxID=2763498 RepID=A0A7G8Q926_9GAMM|nr:fimbrial biogenesis outer membrane usher protein [Dyella telluris]